jgi:hypothetical protein
MGSKEIKETFSVEAGNFGFSGIGIDSLGASEYTLVTIALDVTGSLHGEESSLEEMLKAAIRSCEHSPKPENILLRVVYFSDRFNNSVQEIHGFKHLSAIKVDQEYSGISTGGMTPLCDAAVSSVGSIRRYAERLYDEEYLVNGILFVITDGGENSSSTTTQGVKGEIQNAIKSEKLESLISILIGVGDDNCKSTLEAFKDDAALDVYIDAGDVSERTLARIVNFISQSVSSQSQALGTAGASQNISVTI